MAQDLYARRLTAATAFFRQAESMLEPSYKEKLDMDMAKKKEGMQAELDFYIEKNKIANQSAIEQLRKQKEIEFQQFEKMEDEKYRRQLEMMKDGEFLSASLAHQATLAAHTHAIQTELSEKSLKTEGIKRVKKTPEVEAGLLPSVGRGKFIGVQRQLGMEYFGIAFNANSVIETGNNLLTSLSTVMTDLENAVDSGYDVKNNYLYKRALETVEQSLMHMSNDRVQRRFNFNKTDEQRATYQDQLEQLQRYRNTLLQYSN